MFCCWRCLCYPTRPPPQPSGGMRGWLAGLARLAHPVPSSRSLLLLLPLLALAGSEGDGVHTSSPAEASPSQFSPASNSYTSQCLPSSCHNIPPSDRRGVVDSISIRGSSPQGCQSAGGGLSCLFSSSSFIQPNDNDKYTREDKYEDKDRQLTGLSVC